MVYVQQSAGRLMRALFEIALAKKWASLAEKILDICKMIERRLWLSQCPLRQFTAIPDLICRKLEKVQDIHWDRYSDLKPHDLGELVKMPKMGKTLFKFVHMIPKLIVDARAHPLSRNTLEVNVSLTSDFEFNEQIHGYQLLFWLVVEDGDGDRILYYEPIILKSKTAALGWHFNTSIFVKLYEPLQPQYFLKVISDRWMHSSTCVPISFKHIILPAKGSSPSELLDLRPLPTKALPLILAELLRGIERLNPIQTQLFSTIYEQESNALVCAPVGSGKTVCIQLAIIKFLTSNIDGKCLYIAPSKVSI